MPKSLLQKIEDHIEGRSRTAKIEKCCQAGYEKIIAKGE